MTQPPVQALGSSIKLSVREVRNLAVAVLIFLVVALVPLISSGYVLSISTSILFYTALATSWT